MLFIINLSAGIIIILLALLMKIFNLSNLIAGYNTLSKKEKKKYDEKLLIKYVCNTLLISAAILIAGAIPSILNLNSATIYFTLSWIAFLLFVIFAIIYLNLNKKLNIRI